MLIYRNNLKFKGISLQKKPASAGFLIFIPGKKPKIILVLMAEIEQLQYSMAIGESDIQGGKNLVSIEEGWRWNSWYDA